MMGFPKSPFFRRSIVKTERLLIRLRPAVPSLARGMLVLDLDDLTAKKNQEKIGHCEKCVNGH